MTYDPNYRIKHRVPPVSRLAHYKHLPPRMVGDPHLRYGCARNAWAQRCLALYAAMMAEKHGALPPIQRRGLWMWTCTTTIA